MTANPDPVIDWGQHLLTLKQVAAVLQISPRSVARMMADKRLAVVRIGRSVRVNPDVLTALIKQDPNINL